MWTAIFALGVCAYGLWMILSNKEVGVGLEGERPWFYLSGRSKRTAGILVLLAGLILLWTAFSETPLLG